MGIAATPLRELFDARRWATAFFMLAVIVVFGISPYALDTLGFHYDTEGGAAWQKLHPATYVMVGALTFGFIGLRDHRAFFKSVSRKLPGLLFFLAMWVLLMAHAGIVRHVPLTPLFETFFIAVAALLMLDELPQGVKDFLRLFIHGLLFVNALLGVGEFVTHRRVFPHLIGGENVIADNRSTALLGHPLQNATTSGVYLLCLFLGGDASLAPATRGVLILAQILGLASFGGRTSIVVSSAIIFFNLVKEFGFVLLGSRFDLRRALASASLAPVALACAFWAVSSGILDDTIKRFIDDNGSAEARVIMVRLFDSFSFGDLLIGPDPKAVDTRLRSLGISVGIENSWIAMMFMYGGLMASFFFFGLLALLWEIWRRCRQGASQLFLFFLVVMTSAIGLASKSMVFNEFTLLLLLVFRSEAPKAVAAKAIAATA